MSSTWVWILLGLVVIAALVAIFTSHPSTTTTGGEEVTSGQNVEENVVSELNVEVPEINEAIVDVNIPEEI
jgi:hypothetical protein